MLKVELDQEFNQFLHWLRTAKPGTPYLYHVGLLPVDRQRVFYETTPANGRKPVTVWQEPVHTVALMALGADEMGFAHLIQKKLTEGKYAYMAVRSHSRTPNGLTHILRHELIKAGHAASQPLD